MDFKNYVSNIADLYKNKGKCEIYIKSIKNNLTEDEEKMFYNIFGNICDVIFWKDYLLHGLNLNLMILNQNLIQEIMDKRQKKEKYVLIFIILW